MTFVELSNYINLLILKYYLHNYRNRSIAITIWHFNNDTFQMNMYHSHIWYF